MVYFVDELYCFSCKFCEDVFEDDYVFCRKHLVRIYIKDMEDKADKAECPLGI